MAWLGSGRLDSIYHEDTDKGEGIVLSIDRISLESGEEQSPRINLVEAVSKPWPILTLKLCYCTHVQRKHGLKKKRLCRSVECPGMIHNTRQVIREDDPGSARMTAAPAEIDRCAPRGHYYHKGLACLNQVQAFICQSAAFSLGPVLGVWCSEARSSIPVAKPNYFCFIKSSSQTPKSKLGSFGSWFAVVVVVTNQSGFIPHLKASQLPDHVDHEEEKLTCTTCRDHGRRGLVGPCVCRLGLVY